MSFNLSKRHAAAAAMSTLLVTTAVSNPADAASVTLDGFANGSVVSWTFEGLPSSFNPANDIDPSPEVELFATAFTTSTLTVASATGAVLPAASNSAFLGADDLGSDPDVFGAIFNFDDTLLSSLLILASAPDGTFGGSFIDAVTFIQSNPSGVSVDTAFLSDTMGNNISIDNATLTLSGFEEIEEPQPVPLPGGLPLLAAGVAAFVALRRRDLEL